MRMVLTKRLWQTSSAFTATMKLEHCSGKKLELLYTLMLGLQRGTHRLKVSTVWELKAKHWNASTASGSWELESIKASPAARYLLNQGMEGTCWRNESTCLLTGWYSQLSKNVGKSLIASLCSLLIHLAVNFWTGCLLLHPAYSLIGWIYR